MCRGLLLQLRRGQRHGSWLVRLLLHLHQGPSSASLLSQAACTRQVHEIQWRLHSSARTHRGFSALHACGMPQAACRSRGAGPRLWRFHVAKAASATVHSSVGSDWVSPAGSEQRVPSCAACGVCTALLASDQPRTGGTHGVAEVDEVARAAVCSQASCSLVPAHAQVSPAAQPTGQPEDTQQR